MMDSKVLKLNKNYLPIGIVTVKSAFEMLYSDRAEVVTVEDGVYMSYDFESWAEISELKHELEEFDHIDEFVFTQYLTLQVPRVIRTLAYSKSAHHDVKLSRRNIFLRDNYTCQYCGKIFRSDELTFDHVIPKSKGGINSWKNIVAACFKCNQRKAGRTPDEAGLKLLSVPGKPNHNLTMQYELKISDERYSPWKNFIDESYWNAELKN